MPEEIQQPNPPISSASAPQPQVQPMPSQEEVAPKSGNRKMLVLFSVVLIFALVLLAAGGYLYLNSKKASQLPAQYTQTIPSPTPVVDLSPTPVSTVSSSQDLNTVLNEVNSTTDKDLQNDLNQANSEGNNL